MRLTVRPILIGTLGALACGGSAFGATIERVTGFHGNPVAGNRGFGVIVQNDAVLGSTESEGPVAVGGDLRFGPGYNVSLRTAGSFVAPGDTRPTALLVGGRADLAGSSPSGVLRVLSDGLVKLGSLNGVQARDTDGNGAAVNTRVVATGAAFDSTPRIELTTPQPPASVGPVTGLIDFDRLFGDYRSRSDQLADCPADVVLRDGNGVPLPDQHSITPNSNIKIELSPSRTNVLRLTGAMLDNIAVLTFLDQPSATGPLLIDVDTTGSGGRLDWRTPNMAGLQKSALGSLLWNFPDATTIVNTQGDQIEGTLYAPRALFRDLDPANLEGDVVVRALEAGPLTPGGAVNAGEIHYFPFTAVLDCGRTVPTPTPTPGASTPAPSSSGHHGHSARPTAPEELADTGRSSALLPPGLLAGGLLCVGLLLARSGRRRRH